MERPGLYVHVPFCRAKCPYCDFVSYPRRELIPAWAAAVAAEAGMYAPAFKSFETVYIGGGTPSLIPAGDLARLVEGLKQTLGLEDLAEFTVELNPEDAEAGLLECWRGLGATRLSIGAQSLTPQGLKALSRRHTLDQTLKAVRLARGAGFDELSLDLIWGWEGQTLDALVRELEAALALEPTHLSVYQLTYAPGTLLAKQARRGLVTPLDEDQAADFFLAAASFLAQRGWDHYEVSSFARTLAHRAPHNQKYWSRAPYLGLGPAAHSFDGKNRWWNVRGVKEHAREVAAGRPPREGQERLTAAQAARERLMLGLRTAGGIDPVELEPFFMGLGQRAEGLAAAGFLRREGARLVPTAAGLALADGLASQLAGLD